MMICAHKTQRENNAREFDPDEWIQSKAAKERERKKESDRYNNKRKVKETVPRKDGLISSTVNSFRFFVVAAVVISLPSLRDFFLF